MIPCFVLGSNVLLMQDITLDCNKQHLLIGNANEILYCSLSIVSFTGNVSQHVYISRVVRNVIKVMRHDPKIYITDVAEDTDIDTEDGESEDPNVVPKFLISHESLAMMQNSDYAL